MAGNVIVNGDVTVTGKCTCSTPKPSPKGKKGKGRRLESSMDGGVLPSLGMLRGDPGLTWVAELGGGRPVDHGAEAKHGGR